VISEKMRSPPRSIVFVVNSLTAGGAERALVDLLAYLEDHLRGHNTHLVLLDIEEQLHAVPSWVQTHVLNANFNFFWSTVLLTRLLRDLSPAVTLSFLNRSNCANVISSKLLKYPCIISERTHPTSRFGGGVGGVITKAIMRLTYPLAISLGRPSPPPSGAKLPVRARSQVLVRAVEVVLKEDLLSGFHAIQKIDTIHMKSGAIRGMSGKIERDG
jgi:hypothetical protein